MDYKRSALGSLILFIAFELVLYPLFWSSMNIEPNSLFRLSNFSEILIYGIAPYVIGISIFLIIAILFYGNLLINVVVNFLLAYTLLSGILFPIVLSDEMVDVNSFDINYINLVLCIVLSLAFTILSVTKLRGMFYVFIFMILGMTVFYATQSPLFEKNGKQKKNIFSTLSSNKNILLVSFDGLSKQIVSEIFSNEPSLAANFNEFYFYTNAISQSIGTDSSIRAELFGNSDYQKLGKSGRQINHSLEKKGHVYNNIENSMFYGNYVDFITNKNKTIGDSDIGNSKSDEVYDYNKRFIELLYSRQLGFVINLSYRNSIDEDAHRLSTQNYRGPSWKKDLLYGYENYNWWIKNIGLDDSDFALRAGHFTHTHFPVDFDDKCNFIGHLESRDSNKFLFNELYAETKCALKEWSDLLKKLKELGVYEKTLIILKSDHGAPAGYFENGDGSFTVNNHKHWGVDRYSPVLLIKPFGETKKNITYIKQPVVLSDITKTVCIYISPSIDCSKYYGKNIFDYESLPYVRDFYIEIVKDENSTHKIEDDSTYLLSVDSHGLLKALQNAGFNVSPVKDREKNLINKYLTDLHQINNAVQKYKNIYGVYPKVDGFAGRYSNYGYSGVDWIPGIVPDYIKILPTIKNTNDPELQYLYKSDGNGYKLIKHGDTELCQIVKKIKPEYIDPVRNCWAFGFWSNDAESW